MSDLLIRRPPAGRSSSVCTKDGLRVGWRILWKFARSVALPLYLLEGNRSHGRLAHFCVDVRVRLRCLFLLVLASGILDSSLPRFLRFLHLDRKVAPVDCVPELPFLQGLDAGNG